MASDGLPADTPIAYDMTRLFLGPLSRTPRGIDRVDHAFARHIFGNYPNSVAILPTLWGVRSFDRKRALQGLDRLERLWSETVEPEHDPVWLRLRAQILGKPAPKFAKKHFGWPAKLKRMISLLAATGWSFGKTPVHSLPPGSIYVNTGHLGLLFPIFLRWLDKRPDIFPVFMLHDVIPLENPEYVEPNAVTGHGRMVEMAAKYARAMIVTTRAARLSIEKELSRRTQRSIPMHEQPLPVAEIFRQPVEADPELSEKPYFVTCGAIEPRKNQLFLVELWKQMAGEGDRSSKLIVVGSPGWTGEMLLRQLNAPALAGVVHHVAGLSTPALIRLMKSSRGLLMPSFTEGYGLPIAEAKCLGVPVVASDIPAHREVAGPESVLLSPLDGEGWRKAIGALSTIEASEIQVKDELDWGVYFITMEKWLAGLTEQKVQVH